MLKLPLTSVPKKSTTRIAILKIAKSSPDMDICRQRLAEIRCPTLIIHGSKDAMVASEHPDVLNKQIQGSKYVHFVIPASYYRVSHFEIEFLNWH